MDRESLMKLLNVKPAEVKSAGPAAPSGKETTTPAKPKAPPTEHALDDLDDWVRDQGQKLLRHNHRLRATELKPIPVTDFFGTYFLSDPQTVESCSDERRLEFVRQTLDSPDYVGVHRGTECDPVASEIACQEMAEAFAKLKKDDEQREKEVERKKQRGQKVNPAREQAKADAALVAACIAAVGQAKEKVEEYEEMRESCGMGKGETNGKPIDPARLYNAFNRIKDEAKLRRIFDKAGRYRRFAQSQQRRKVKHGYDDMIGVVMDGDVGRLLPQELAALATPELEDDAMRRLVERQMMCREYQGKENVGRGPVVGVFDESGSMGGWKIEDAKAIAMALYWIARHQNRWCVLVGFAGGTEGNVLALPPGKPKEGELMDWLLHNFGGGTDCDIPMVELPNRYWPDLLKQGMPRGKTDVLIVTDGILHVPTEIEQAFLAWKQREKVRCIGLMVGSVGGRAGGLERVVDEYHPVGHLSLDNPGVQNALSI